MSNRDGESRRIRTQSKYDALTAAQEPKRETFQAGYEWAEQVGNAVKRAEHAEAEAARLREQVQALQDELDEVRNRRVIPAGWYHSTEDY